MIRGRYSPSGILSIANGGTGKDTWTANQIVYAPSTNVLGQSANMTFTENVDPGQSFMLLNGKLKVGDKIPINTAPFDSVLDSAKAAITCDVNTISGLLLGNINTTNNPGTGNPGRADFRFAILDSTHNYTTVAMPGVANTLGTLFGKARATTAFIFNAGGTTRDMAIGTLGNNSLTFGTDNTARMTIASAGTVGIGTPTPGAMLDVLRTTTQLRLSYSAAVYADFAVNNGGFLTITPTSERVRFVDNLDVKNIFGGEVVGSNLLLRGRYNATDGVINFGNPVHESRFDEFSGTGGNTNLLRIDGTILSLGTLETEGNLILRSTANIEKLTNDLTITTAAGKTVVLSQAVYKDINISGALLSKPASSAPGTDTFRTSTPTDTGIETYAFAVGEKVHGGFELQHDYKEGTDLVFHVHWQGIAAPAGGTDNVQWRLNYIVTRDGVTLTAVTEIDTPDVAIDTQYRFYRNAFAAIDGTNFKIGDQFMFTLTRVAAVSDDYAGDCLIATAGIHYQCDTLGSRTIGDK